MPAPGHTVLLGSGAADAGSAQENHTEGSAVALGHSRFLSTSQFLASVDQLILWGFCSIAILPDPANSLGMSLETADTEVSEQWSPCLSAGRSAAPPVLQKALSQQHYPCWSAGGCSCCVFVCLQSWGERVAASKGSVEPAGAVLHRCHTEQESSPWS